MFYAITSLIVIGQLLWMTKIDYPPSLEQINFGINSPLSLIFIRIISFLIFVFICFLISKKINSKSKVFFLFFIFSIPAISSWILSYPSVIFRLLLIVLISFYITRLKSFFPKTIFIITGIIAIYLYNVTLLNLRPAFFDIIDVKKNQAELTHRIYTEDKINPHIDLPLVFRRLGYNKYLFILKNFSNHSLKFLDFESLFFQEVHPLEQKGFVIFYWPLIWLFILSLYLVLKKIIVIHSIFYYSFLFAYISYLFSDQPPEQFLAPLIFIISALFSSAIVYLNSDKIFFKKSVAVLFIFITFYAFGNNLLDRFKRPDYWLDNRPLAFKFWFENLKNLNLSGLRIVMTDIVGPSSSYCQYFLKDCQNFSFTNFNLSETKPVEDMIYIGYIGNFLGRENQNHFPLDQQQIISTRGYQILAHTSLRDDVVFGYGNNIYVTKYNEPKTK